MSPVPHSHSPFARRAVLVLALVLALLLGGTVVVLGSVSHFLALPPQAFLSEVEVPWDQWDTISPIRDLDTLGGEADGQWRYYMREDWDGQVRNTDSWDRLYDIVPREGERIPRLIHQTWKSDVLPEKWRDAWRECREGMPDYEYMLWTDALSRQLIETHYPEFLPTFDGYQYPIERADAIRYFILHHFGGIYMDLDIGCRRRLDGLLAGDWDVILPVTKPVGVSNDLLFSSPRSEFMASLIKALPYFDHSWIINYPTVMFSTGPMFVSTLYSVWASNNPLAESLHSPVRILPKSLYGKNALPEDVPHSFFAHFYGSSWHDDDAGFFWFLADYGRSILIIMGVVIGLAVLRLVWLRRRVSGYTPVAILPTSSPSSLSLSSLSTPSTLSAPPSPKLEPISPGIVDVVRAAGSRLLAVPSAVLGRGGWRRGPILPSIRVEHHLHRRSSDVSTATMVDPASSASSPLLRTPVIDEWDEKANSSRARSPRSLGRSEAADGMEEVDAFLRVHSSKEA